MSKESSQVRSIPDGRDLLEGLLEAFAGEAGWVLATGQLDGVELKLAAHDGPARRALSGSYTLVQLGGPLGGPYGVTLSRVERERVDVLAGFLLRGRAQGVSACCLGSALAASAPETNADAVRAADPPAAPANTASSWVAQAKASALAAAAADLEVPEPERGDWIEHFAFGVCEVVGANGDRLLIRDVSGSGRVREIRADALVVHPPIERDGKRVFRLSRRG